MEIYVSTGPQIRLVPLDGANLNWSYLEGREVVEHLLRIASDLDSMVVDEAEIADQVRRAFTAALD